MEGDHIKICMWLAPLSWLYGFGVWVRNVLFDYGVLRSESFSIPVINVGNITVGGTGKTPHTEYLIRLLFKKMHVAVLSRGYKRKSKDFRLAITDTPMQEIGDEPYQMKQKFPDVTIAVDRDRCNGIRQLMSGEIQPAVDVVILDDAYQHRYVKPGMNILLMDYHRLICFDKLLPAGRLRESREGQDRADVIIVTKCPANITPMEQRGIERSLGVYTWQKLFFSYFQYGEMYPLFDKAKEQLPLNRIKEVADAVMLLTGIASPIQMEEDVRKYTDFVPLHFSDHHNFTPEDVNKIVYVFNSMRGDKRIIITTEKDSVRLLQCNLPTAVKQALYVLPVEVAFINGKAKEFNKIITDYVYKNSRNCSLS